MATQRTRNIYSHALNIIRGDRGYIHNLLYTAKKSDNVTFELYEGRCVHLNADGEFETGATGNQMPMFICSGSESDPDTEQTYSNDDYQALPVGNLTAIVATAGVELSTTEFDTARTYAPNDPLRAPTANSTEATGGVLTNQGVVKLPTGGSTLICGIVSSGVGPHPNARNEEVLSFWPIFQMGVA